MNPKLAAVRFFVLGWGAGGAVTGISNTLGTLWPVTIATCVLVLVLAVTLAVTGLRSSRAGDAEQKAFYDALGPPPGWRAEE